jgi:hypothetical protein
MAVDGTYRGPLADVIADLLRGCNYVLTTREGRTEVLIVGRAGTPNADLSQTTSAPWLHPPGRH